jgi:hypothetical protein
MAATTVTTTMARAINYTVVTDTSADWASVTSSTYFYDKAAKLVYYKDANGVGVQYYTDRECAFASIGDGLTDTEAANFYTAVQAYQTTLSRQV